MPSLHLHCLELSGDFWYIDREFGYFFSPRLCTYVVQITDVEEKEKMKVDSRKAELEPYNLKKRALRGIGTCSLWC